MASPQLEDQDMEIEYEEQDLKRKPIDRGHLKEIQYNSKVKKNLYPTLECRKEYDDSNMDDDTHSVQNDVDDPEMDGDYLVLNTPNIDVDCTSHVIVQSNVNSKLSPRQKEVVASLNRSWENKNARSNVNSKLSPRQNEISASYRAEDNKKARLRKNLKSGEPNQQFDYQASNLTKPSLRYTPESCGLKNKTNGTGITSNFIYCILSLLFLLLVGLFGWSNSTENVRTVTWNYDSIVSRFTHSFVDQPELSLRVVKSALKLINTTDPTAPAIILFLASKGAENLARSLGKKLVDSVSPYPIKISGEDYAYLDSDTGKKSIDDALRSMKGYSDSAYGAVLVENLHLIPGETALMFHTYCDNENAPYKHAVYVLIVDMGEKIPFNSKVKDWDSAAYKLLNTAWNDIDEDQRGPLLSRLTVSVAAIVENDVKV